MDNIRNASLGVIRGATAVAEVLGLPTSLTKVMINSGEIPGYMTGTDLRTFTTTRQALKDHFDGLAKADREERKRAGLSKATAKKLKSNVEQHEIEEKLAAIRASCPSAFANDYKVTDEEIHEASE